MTWLVAPKGGLVDGGWPCARPRTTPIDQVDNGVAGHGHPVSGGMPQKRATRSASAIELTSLLPTGPTVEDACHWLSRTPPLEEVASALRSMRLLQKELSQVIDLLRQHALLELGEPTTGLGRGVSEEPF